MSSGNYESPEIIRDVGIECISKPDELRAGVPKNSLCLRECDVEDFDWDGSKGTHSSTMPEREAQAAFVIGQFLEHLESPEASGDILRGAPLVADSEPSGDSLTSLNLFRAFSEIGGLEQALKDFLRPVYYKAEDIAPIVGMDHVLSKIGLRVARNGGSLSLWFNPEILYWAYFLPNDDEALLSSQRNLHRSTLKKLSLLAEGVFESEEIESLREEIAGYIYSQAQSGLLTQPGGLYDYIAYCSAMYLLPTAKLRDLLPKD